MTDLDRMLAMLQKADNKFEKSAFMGVPIIEICIEQGICGSREGWVMACFKADGSFNGFIWDD